MFDFQNSTCRPDQVIRKKYFTPFWPKLFTGPFSNPKISQNSYENRPKFGSWSMLWKHIHHLLSKNPLNVDFDILESWKIITDLQYCELFLDLKMALNLSKNTYMGYGSCTAMIVACSILIIIISKPRKIPTHKTRQQK